MIFQLIKSTSTDPFVNLALENYLLLFFRDTIFLLLWQNDPCLVIGRNQLSKYECNVSLLQELNIPLVRRYSGGGAVFHDLGNSNYSLITNKEQFSRTQGCALVQGAMKRLGIELSISTRHDLWDKNEKKVSGSAYRLTNSRAYHHGTMLRKTDLILLNQLLQQSPDEECIEGENLPLIRSIKSPVGNIGIEHEEFCNAMSDEFKHYFNTNIGEEILGNDEILQRGGTRHFYNELKSQEWIWRRNHLKTFVPEADRYNEASKNF
jgi:lipoate-protein ligase A